LAQGFTQGRKKGTLGLDHGGDSTGVRPPGARVDTKCEEMHTLSRSFQAAAKRVE
jgi:hypothetical protein